MEVSVIVPVYNAEKTLEKCVKSLEVQTHSIEMEFILVDDGSTDASLKMCQEFAREDERVQVVHKANGGCLAARNTGVNMAKGRYIAFVDSDDWIAKDCIEKLYSISQKYCADIVMCNHVLKEGMLERDGTEYPQFGVFQGNDVYRLYNGMIFNGKPFGRTITASLCGKLFRRELIERTLKDVDKRIAIGEDASITYPAMMRAQTVVQVPEALYWYVQNPQSMTHRYMPNYPMQAELLYHHLLHEAKEQKCFNFTKQIEGNYISMIVSAIGNLFQSGAPHRPVQKSILQQICSNSEITRIMRDFDYSQFNTKEKIVCWLLKNQYAGLLFFYESAISALKKARKGLGV